MSDKLDLQSSDLVNQNIQKIAALFPNCITETAEGKAIDFDLLRQELNHEIVEGAKERYRLEWPGKREAIVTANLPTTKTLPPVPEESVNFDTTENLYIEGDNLEVLKLLQESYLGKIKMISIDPPYNTGNDFVYKDNFAQDSGEFKLDDAQTDDQNNRLIANPETNGRYHSDWLTMMYPRLKLARNLLTEDGALFISIDDVEVDNLNKLCCEIFGGESFVAKFIWKSRQTPDSRKSTKVSTDHEYILCYARRFDKFSLSGKEIDETKYTNPDNDPRGPWASENLTVQATKDQRPNQFYDIVDPSTGIHYPANPQRVWAKSKSVIEDMIITNRILFPQNPNGRPRGKKFLNDLQSVTTGLSTWLDSNQVGYTTTGTKEFSSIFEERIFDFPKPSKLLATLIQQGTGDDSIILDFFSGSSTSAHAVMLVNSKENGKRKFIQVQIPAITDKNGQAYKSGYKNICEIGKERIRRAGKKITDELNAKIEKQKAEQAGKLDFDNDGQSSLQEDYKLDIGFRVYRLDTSNMQDVYYRPQDYKPEMMDLFADNIKPDRTPRDLLAQVMLDWGLPLSYRIEEMQIDGKQVFRVAQDSLMACFDNGINEAFAKELATYKPLRVVFRDRSFANDTAKENVKQLLKQLSPETEMKVI